MIKAKIVKNFEKEDKKKETKERKQINKPQCIYSTPPL